MGELEVQQISLTGAMLVFRLLQFQVQPRFVGPQLGLTKRAAN